MSRFHIAIALLLASCTPKESPVPAPSERKEHVESDATSTKAPLPEEVVLAHQWLRAFVKNDKNELARISSFPFFQSGFYNVGTACEEEVPDDHAFDALLSCMRTDEETEMLYRMGWHWLGTMKSPAQSSDGWNVTTVEDLKRWPFFRRNSEVLESLRSMTTVQLDLGVRGEGGCLFAVGIQKEKPLVQAVLANCWVE